MKLGKATHNQLRQHNRQLLLRSIFNGVANNRAALAQATGLAKPTVSDLIGELIEDGLLIEGGRGESTDSGGKRPRLLEFVPYSRQVIGVAIDGYNAFGILSNLDGQIVAHHYADLHDLKGDEILALIKEVINGLIAQLDAPLLCLGIGVPGLVDNTSGVVLRSTALGWQDLPLSDLLQDHFNTPVFIANNTELAAVGQATFKSGDVYDKLATVLINTSIEVGMVLGSAVYHSGGDIGYLRVSGKHVDDAANSESRLSSFLGWEHIKDRAAQLKQTHPESGLPDDDLTYLHIRHSAVNGDEAALQLYEEIADYLAEVFAWIIGIIRPDHIALAGSIADLGDLLLERIVSKTSEMLYPGMVQPITFALAADVNLSALGAVAHALNRELGIP